MDKYPMVDLDLLTNVVRIIENSLDDPRYLEPGICPYDGDTIKKLQGLVKLSVITEKEKPEAAPVGRPKKAPPLPVDEVEKEIEDLRVELRQLKIDGKNLEVNDRIQIIKTRAALFEKIVAMKERTNSLKKQSAFVSNIISIMEDIMDQTQRETMIKRMEPYLDQ